MSDHDGKGAARAEALERRRAAHAAGAPGAGRLAAGHALEVIAGLRGAAVVAAYLPIRDEIDPMPAMLALSGLGYATAVPVIEGRGLPLVFRRWTQGVATVPGPFGVPVPAAGETLEPDVLIVPMLAFDRRGHRLGYGGGFYDRTIGGLRARREVTAIGFAYADQEMREVPDSEHDMRLDAIVTEQGVMRPG
ncbi:MAG TPA: 5-formyltetrahydrofolate cyclo-ligase [Amaricoccus sp.]|nr:5-formyltetrahydrofolate cyclo-ligase [Amaricoccus sp.]